VEVDPEREVLVTIGSKEGIGHELLGLLSEGDAVLAPTPTYPIHAYGAVLAGAETLPVAVGPGIDFFDSLVATTEKAEKRPKGIVVNFPANPTAAVATPELFEKIVRFAGRHLFIISDLQPHIVFDGQRASRCSPSQGARASRVLSLSKATDGGLSRRVLRGLPRSSPRPHA
jgi:alanine-synthesizing transaminase